jgi:hypothetical protein
LVTQRQKTPLFPDQSRKSERFEKDVTLDNEISGKREGYSTFKHERRYSADTAV